MKEYIFSFNYAGYISRGIERKDENTFILDGYNIYTHDLEYPELLDIIKKKFGQEIELISIKYLQIQHSNIYSHSPTDHILISFRSNRENNIEDKDYELQDKLETIFNSISDISKIYYFISNLFIDFQISLSIEDFISADIKNKDLRISPAFKITPNGFFITLTSFLHKNYSEIISKAIKRFIDNHFANLMGTRVLNINEIKLHHLSEGNFSNLENYLIVELLPFLSRQISDYNIRIVPLLDDFKSILYEMQNSFDKYEFLVLIDLEKYFYEIRNSLDLKFRIFPNIEYGDLFFSETPIDQQQTNFFHKKQILKLCKIHRQDFQKNRENLKSELNRMMNMIRSLIFQKRNKIKIYTKSQLKDILENVKDEQEFQDLISRILYDLGYTDIKMNCGRRGHSELGKDIVFSHRNIFQQQEWDAIVVKTGKINQPRARVDIRKDVKDIIAKGSEALDIPYKDEKGREFKITRVFIATNDKITDPAKESIRTNIEGNVFFIEKDTLLNLCQP